MTENHDSVLLRRVLGSSFNALPPPMRALHRVDGVIFARGRCRVERGAGIIVRLLGALLALPPDCPDGRIAVSMRQEGEGEVWLRVIDGARFQSRLTDRGEGRLTESIGPVTFIFLVRGGPEGFQWVLEDCKVLGLRLPKGLRPVIRAREWVEQNVVQFDISAALPLLGPVVAYRGNLLPQAAQPGKVPGQPLMLFDGICNFCNRGVDFFLRRDTHGRIRFAAMQSEAGSDLLRAHDLPVDDYETFIVLDGDKLLDRSMAVLHLLGTIGWPWSILRVCALIPRPLRDWLYGLVARNRYRLMGRREVCRVPSPEERSRFL